MRIDDLPVTVDSGMIVPVLHNMENIFERQFGSSSYAVVTGGNADGAGDTMVNR